jgi:hypothetical protein
MAFTILERRLRDILHRVTSIYPGARSQHARGTFVRSQRTSIGSSPRRTDEQHRQLKQYLESYWWGNPGDPSSAVATAASHSVNDLCSYFPNTSIPNQGHGSGESTSNRSRVKIQEPHHHVIAEPFLYFGFHETGISEWRTLPLIFYLDPNTACG